MARSTIHPGGSAAAANVSPSDVAG